MDDRKPVPKLAERLWGRLFGDKGSLSQPLTQQVLQTQRVRLVIPLKRTMANRLLVLHDTVLLRRRCLIETVFDQLKYLLQIGHTRHHSPTSVAVNLLAGLITYDHEPTKPSIFEVGDRN